MASNISLSDKYSVLKLVDLLKMMNKHFSREDLKLGYVLCPFHDDKHPSLRITRFEGIYRYKCMSASCGCQGDAFTFLHDTLKLLTMQDKVRWLLENNCLTTLNSDGDPKSALSEKLIAALGKDKAHEEEFQKVADFAFDILRGARVDNTYSDVVSHIATKFVLDINHAIDLDIGIFDMDLMQTLHVKSEFWKDIGFDFKLKEMYHKCAVLMLRNSKDTFGGFILSPVGLGSRDYRQYMYKGAKVYGGLQLLDVDNTGTGQIANDDYTIVVEGFSDMSAIQSRCMLEYGTYINCVSVQGTGGFNNKVALHSLEAVASYTRRKIAFWPDNDAPGLEAISQMCHSAKGLNIKPTILYPKRYDDGDDPADYTKKYNTEAMGVPYPVMIDNSRYSIPEFYYRYASEQIIRRGIADKMEECQAFYIELAIKSGLAGLDADNYVEYICNGLPVAGGGLAYDIDIKASKASLLNEIQNSCTGFRELQTPEGTYVIHSNAINRVQTKTDSHGNETRINRPVTNFSFMLTHVIHGHGVKTLYKGDLTHKTNNGYTTKPGITLTNEEYEPGKFLNTLALSVGGTNFIAPTKTDEKQRVRDICLMTWPDTVNIKAYDAFGYNKDRDTGELVHLLGTHYVSRTTIGAADKYFVDTPNDAGQYGYDLPPFTEVEDLNRSVRYCLDEVLWKLFPGYEHHITLPFMCALTSPLWYFAPSHKRFVLYTTGPFGCGKTQTHRLMKALMYRYSHFDKSGMSFSSTVNYLEKALSCINDMLGVIDDYKEELTNSRPVVQLIQSLHDGQGKGRMTKELGLAATNTSRCMLLMSGEDFPSMAQGATVSRLLYQVLPDKVFSYAPVEKMIRTAETYRDFQGWFPAYIQHVMQNGIEDAKTPFTDGASRISQHSNICFKAWKTFKRFCIERAGFAPDDPLLIKFESGCIKDLTEVANATVDKSSSESKWEIFKRNMLQLLMCRRAAMQIQGRASTVSAGSVIVGELINAGNTSYLVFRPEVSLSLLRKEVHKTLTTSGVFSAMKAERCLAALRVGENIVESTESTRWIIKKEKFFENDEQFNTFKDLSEHESFI